MMRARQKLKTVCDWGLGCIARQCLPAATTLDKEAAARLRQELSSFEHTQSRGIAGDAWQYNMRQLSRLARSPDPRDFLTWDIVRATMFIGTSRFVTAELNALKRDAASWRSRWKRVVREDRMGAPAPYPLWVLSSGNRIHHTYHVMQMENALGLRVADIDCLVEFGGGYGSLCRVMRKAGFMGTYIIVDLPPFSSLQRYYLSSVGEHVCAEPGPRCVTCVSNTDALQKALEKVGKSVGQRSLVIATWSLSEAPLAVRDTFLARVAGLDHFFIAYQPTFCGWDNSKYFSALQESRAELIWCESEIETLPGNYYLSATPRGTAAFNMTTKSPPCSGPKS